MVLRSIEMQAAIRHDRRTCLLSRDLEKEFLDFISLVLPHDRFYLECHPRYGYGYLVKRKDYSPMARIRTGDKIARLMDSFF
jgi:hypothetical protein